MDYQFSEMVEGFLKKSGKTKKSLYEYLGMSMQGFDSMMKNNSFSAVRLAKIAEFFEVEVSVFYGKSPAKSEQKESFGEEILDKLYGDIKELKLFFEEELRIKNQQIAGLQRTVDVLVGKSEGVINEPLSIGQVSFKQTFDSYRSSVVKQFPQIPIPEPVAKVVAPR